MRRLLTVVSLLLCASSARATLLLDWDLDELVSRADLIVVGTVGDQTTVRVDGRVMTETVVHVERTLLGKARQSFVLSQLGGREGAIVTDVVGTARLRRGDRLVMVTYRHSDQRRYLVGMSLGAFRADDGRLVQNVDVSLVDAAGEVKPAPGRRELVLDDLIETIGRLAR